MSTAPCGGALRPALSTTPPAPRSAVTRLWGVSSSPLPHRVHAVAETSQPEHGTTDLPSKETDQRREMSINSGAFETQLGPPLPLSLRVPSATSANLTTPSAAGSTRGRCHSICRPSVTQQRRTPRRRPKLLEPLLAASLPRPPGFGRASLQSYRSPLDASAMFADAIGVGNKLAAGPAGMSALGQTFRATELPVSARFRPLRPRTLDLEREPRAVTAPPTSALVTKRAESSVSLGRCIQMRKDHASDSSEFKHIETVGGQ